MNLNTRMMINKIADAIRKQYNVSTPIIDFKDLIENKLNGELKEENFLPEFADARIEKKGDSFIISVLQNANESRKRFSIAHELGHLFIHMGYKISEETWENSDNVFNRLDSGELEFQANEFAAALLMPEEKFIKVMNDNYNKGSYNMENVAEYFNVSLEAAINRGRWLNLLSWG